MFPCIEFHIEPSNGFWMEVGAERLIWGVVLDQDL